MRAASILSARSTKDWLPFRARRRFLAALAEQEMVERNRRRFERHLEEARLPPGKTLDTFDFTAVPMISKAQVQALAAGVDGEGGQPAPGPVGDQPVMVCRRIV